MIADGQTFVRVTVNIDGGSYRKCKFEHCNLVFNGAMPFSLEGCDFVECRWSFAGAALLTVRCMAGLYAQGGGGKDLVEGMFNQIRGPAGQAAA